MQTFPAHVAIKDIWFFKLVLVPLRIIMRFHQRLIQSGFSHVFGVYSEPIEIAWQYLSIYLIIQFQKSFIPNKLTSTFSAVFLLILAKNIFLNLSNNKNNLNKILNIECLEGQKGFRLTSVSFGQTDIRYTYIFTNPLNRYQVLIYSQIL